MELIDQLLWEQELTEHLKQSGTDPEEFSRPARTEPALAEPALAEPALAEQAPAEPAPESTPQLAPVMTEEPSAPSPLPSFVLIPLWTVVLLALSGVGWAVGWFLL